MILIKYVHLEIQINKEHTVLAAIGIIASGISYSNAV